MAVYVGIFTLHFVLKHALFAFHDIAFILRSAQFLAVMCMMQCIEWIFIWLIRTKFADTYQCDAMKNPLLQPTHIYGAEIQRENYTRV